MKVYKIALQTGEDMCKALGGEYNKIEGLCYISGKVVDELKLKIRDLEIIIKRGEKK